MRCIKDKTFETKIEINDSFENTIFWNCVFKDDIEIVDIHSKRIIRFYGCQIEKSCFVKTLDKNVSPIEIDISFSSSKIKYLQIGDKSLHEYNWTIDICDTEIDYCNIRNCVCDKININKSEIDDLTIDSCIWKEIDSSYINLYDSKIENLYINRISYNMLDIYDSKFGSFNINESYFKSELNIKSSTIREEAKIRLIKNSLLYIQKSIFESKLNCEYDNEYKKESNGKIIIKDITVKEQAKFVSEHDIFFDTIDINVTPQLIGEISFIGFNIKDRLVLSGFNKNADIRFLAVAAHSVIFIGYMNWGTTSFLFLRSYLPDKESFFSCLGPTYMGTMIFDGSDIDSFTNIQILETSLNGIKYTNLKWPSPERIIPYQDLDEKYWNKKKEIYRQLKYCAEDNKDKIQTLIFKAYEIDAYQHTLSWKRDFSDLLMLWLNKISNNHGLSWNRGLFFTIFCGLLFYLIFYGCYDDLSYRMYFWGNFIKYIWLFNGIDDLIQFLNQPSNSFGDCLIRFLGSICYIIGKILVAYGIFQTISAFRKYVKAD